MYGFNQAKTTLGLDTIFSIIAHSCVSELGKERIFNFVPAINKNALQNNLAILNDVTKTIAKHGRLPLRSFTDIRILINKVEPQNSFLEIKECQEIQNFLEIIDDLLIYFKNPEIVENSVTSLLKSLHQEKQLLSQLQFTIDPTGAIYDNASKDLKAIRKSLSKLRDEVHRKLEHISTKNAEHLQEDFVTLRDGRLVLPVREFSVSKITGIVHGQSSSGATKYVEPMAVVEINNDIQELLIQEKKEIIKILTRLSSMIREAGPNLAENLKLVTELDTLQARYQYGLKVKGEIPEITNDFYWQIRNGSHPVLLDRIKDETVPLSLEIGTDYDMLIISGPNAGGKTVALKTVGLLQLMLQCAIPIPVDLGSKFPICEQIFVSIGDKQSLENDLSTFSSHIQGLNSILNNVKKNALILIDEIGIGTEPSGGAALAIAVLEQLNKPDIVTMVSTHQNQLKLFASETDGIENGAMQFDVDELKPLFILETGVPGSSFTFDICKRFGMDDNIINRSRKLEGNSNQEIDKLLNDISEKSMFYQKEVRELSLKQSKLDGLINLYDKNSSEIKSNRKKLEKEAKQQAKEIIENANKKIEAVIREIKESAAENKIVKNARMQLNAYKKDLKTSSKSKPVNDLKIAEIKVGQKARALAFNITGQISKVFKSKKAVELEREGVKITVNLSDIELLNESGQPVIQKTESQNVIHISANVSHEVDVRGLESIDAVEQVDAYLDSAVHSQWNEVTIIHGKGTGVLRQAIQQYLKKNKAIKTFRTGRYGEGDAGVTVVSLK